MNEPRAETLEGQAIRRREERRSPGGRRFVRLSDPLEAAPADRRTAEDRRAVPGPGPVELAILRALNFVVAVGALLLLAPFALVIGILIKLDSPGPVIYRQLRVGLDRRQRADDEASGRRASDMGGRPFTMFKFRTMRVDAEKDSGPVWAKPEDGRATRVGALLRKTRLDEIPQFWNVIRGDMSVVGPRPERPSFVRDLRRELIAYPMRHRVPPGITGWAQVNRGYDQSLEDVREKLDLDLEYLQRRSVWFDLRIMLRTIPVMFERRRSE
jgi:lipopolysaccharide/colanic/teichoic acid biosynthesis glycosyltransferase